VRDFSNKDPMMYFSIGTERSRGIRLGQIAIGVSNNSLFFTP
jgi:hypothetical protein